MPKIPTYQAEVQYRPALGDVDAAGASGRALARGAGQAFDALADFAVQQKRAREVAELSQFNLEAAKSMGELELEFDRDTDFATQPQRFDERTKALREEMLGRITSSTVKGAFQRDFDKLAISKGISVKRDAFKREIDSGVASMDANLDTYAELAAGARNDVEYADLVGQARLEIQSKADAGFISREAAGKKERAFLSKLDEAQVLARMNGGEESVAGVLDDLRGGGYKNLDEVARERMIRTGQARADSISRERVAGEDRRERRAERELKHGQALAEADFISKVDQDPDSVNEVRLRDALSSQKISADGYRLIVARRQGNLGGVDNPHVVTDLQARMIRDKEDIHEELTRAAENKQISAKTLGDLMGENQRRQEGLAQQDWRNDSERDAFENLRLSISGDKSGLAILDTNTAQRLADAQREFRQRVKGQAEDEWAVLDDIKAKYIQNVAPPPKVGYGIGEPKSIDDIKAGGLSLRAKRDAGQISASDYEREMRVLMQWQQSLPTAQPKPEPKKK